MFEFLNSFWGGAVSLASGLVVIAAAGRLFTFRPKLVLYDFRSYQAKQRNVPSEVSVAYEFEQIRVASLHITELIIKNESGSPISDSSFLTIPSLGIEEGNTIVFSRQIKGIDESFGEISRAESGEKLNLTDLTVPIDSSITFEFATEKPIDHRLICVHKDVKVKRRNYGVIRRSVFMYYIFPLIFFFGSFATSVALEITSGSAEFSILSFSREILSPIGMNPFIESLAAVFSIILFSLAIVFLYRLYLNASAAERRFTESKVEAN